MYTDACEICNSQVEAENCIGQMIIAFLDSEFLEKVLLDQLD